MRNIERIIIHCTATPGDVDSATVKRWHTSPPRNWSDIGYHFLIRTDGTIEAGRPLDRMGAHTKGKNEGSVGIAYAGGVDNEERPLDTRTKQQKFALAMLIGSLRHVFPSIKFLNGHNEFSTKACPSFDVQKEYKLFGFER